MRLPCERLFILIQPRFGRLRLAAKIVPQELEVLLVGDPPIAIPINFNKEYPERGLVSPHLKIPQRILHRLHKLPQIHNPIPAPLIPLIQVQPLYGHFPRMHLQQKIRNLIISNLLIAVLIIPEDIHQHILYLVFGLFEQLLEHLGDLVLFEEFVIVLVVFADEEEDLLADSQG